MPQLGNSARLKGFHFENSMRFRAKAILFIG